MLNSKGNEQNLIRHLTNLLQISYLVHLARLPVRKHDFYLNRQTCCVLKSFWTRDAFRYFCF